MSLTSKGDPIAAGGLLAHFTVTLDVKNLRVRLARKSAEPIAMTALIVPGFECDLRKDPMPVIEVLPGSEAERAGLRVGDLIEAVNDKGPLAGLFAATEDTPLMLKVRRKGQMVTLRVPFTTLVR